MNEQYQNLQNGYDRYSQAIFLIFGDRMKSALQRHGDELNEKLIDSLLVRQQQLEINPHNFIEEKHPHMILFYGFNEIANSYYVLKDCEIYIRRFPFSKTGITKECYFQFIIGAYYSEIYILKERLESYSTKIQRIFNKAGLPFDDKSLKRIYYKYLKGVLKVRRQHIHENRIEVNEIERLRALNFLIQKVDGEEPFNRFAKIIYNMDYKKIRKEWTILFKNNNNEIKKMLDLYFDLLYPMVFNPDTNQPKI